jgi:AraC-like DNA-binding protein
MPPARYRRLKACGVEFTDLQPNLRRELALLHVGEPHLPLTEIALALGYSEFSGFSRDFRALTGVSPNLYRRRCGREVWRRAPFEAKTATV